MPFIQTEFPGLMIFEPIVFEDQRGFFFESYNEKIFAAAGLNHNWVQDNQSKSYYGVIRGLHYQLHPQAQAKLVRVLEGSIWDVAVDIRKGSPTYAKVFGIELSDINKLQLLIPNGFAHGFSVLSETASVFYKCDNLYSRECEGSIIYNDPVLQIDWKIPQEKLILSEKDKKHPGFVDARNNFEFEG
jgi:dTDP-4-dehydrorhamnose 3,5-epimerase